MAFGVVIIGDEILSGRRADRHLPRAIELLAERGLTLAWARYVGDDRARLTETLKDAFASGDVVFSFGGIGATPDDHTRQAAAAAAGVPLQLHPEAEIELCERFGRPLSAARARLGEFPLGARIIPNPYNRVSGFALGSVHFMPGFPEMSWPMMAWVLDSWYAPLHHSQAQTEVSVRVFEARESDLVELMESLEARLPVGIFSLPSLGSESVRPHIELGAKGAPEVVEQAMAEILATLRAQGLEWEDAADTRPAARVSKPG